MRLETLYLQIKLFYLYLSALETFAYSAICIYFVDA